MKMQLSITGLLGRAIGLIKTNGHDEGVGFALAQLHDHLEEVSLDQRRIAEFMDLYVFDDTSLINEEYPR